MARSTVCVHVGDTAYFSLPIRERISPLSNLVSIARLSSNRNVSAPSEGTGKKKYGATRQLNNPSTHLTPNEVIEDEAIGAKNKKIIIKMTQWDDLLLRGSRTFKGY